MRTLRNSVQLIGRLGKNPETRHFESGKVMSKFSLATNETRKNNDGDRTVETYWHNIVAWGKTAEIAEKYLEKGKEVAVEGKLVTRSYETSNGEKRYVTEVVLNELQILTPKTAA